MKNITVQTPLQISDAFIQFEDHYPALFSFRELHRAPSVYSESS